MTERPLNRPRVLRRCVAVRLASQKGSLEIEYVLTRAAHLVAEQRCVVADSSLAFREEDSRRAKIPS